MADTGKLTGRHVAVITVGAFAVIVGVNLVMAWKAVSTFPGIEVKNSYVASQGWNAARDAQIALGWRLTQEYREGVLTLRFTDSGGLPAPVAGLSVLVGRATEARDDVIPAFQREGGAFHADLPLAPGKWLVRVEALAEDGTAFRQRLSLSVRG
ncbi:MAG: FixH family protein [Paracoccaceae bacterium]|nr:MAG: FixH family protein [Paracoccaceae bacterium]